VGEREKNVNCENIERKREPRLDEHEFVQTKNKTATYFHHDFLTVGRLSYCVQCDGGSKPYGLGLEHVSKSEARYKLLTKKPVK
jgi:hypothetical protein